MVNIASPYIDESIIPGLKIPKDTKLWWSSKKAKSGYKNLNKKYKKLCNSLIIDIVNNNNLDKYSRHSHNVSGIKEKIINVHLEPNVSSEADTVNDSTPIKHKGKYILIFTIKVDSDILIYEILNIGDHSILSEDYSDIK